MVHVIDPHAAIDVPRSHTAFALPSPQPTIATINKDEITPIALRILRLRGPDADVLPCKIKNPRSGSGPRVGGSGGRQLELPTTRIRIGGVVRRLGVHVC